MNGYLIKIVSSQLTDGSRVFDLHISDSGAEPLIIDCVSEKDAFALADKITLAIREHTNESARLVSDGRIVCELEILERTYETDQAQ